MKVYITKRHNLKDNYLANWTSPEGYGFGQWFRTMKELKEYTADWNAEYIMVNEEEE